MPDVEINHAASYIIELLYSAGLMSSNGMGPVPLSWQEIDAWLRVTEYELPMMERLLVRQLSIEYVDELVQATDPQRPAPFVYRTEEEIELERIREDVGDRLRNMLRMFKRKAPEEIEISEEESEEN